MNAKSNDLKKYRDKIKPNKKSFNDMLSFLQQKFNIEHISPNDIDQIYLNMNKENIILSNEEKKTTLPLEQLDIFVYKIVNDCKSSEYYECFTSLPNNNDIIFLAEKKTEYWTTNCTRLQIELFLYLSLTKEEYDQETPQFWFLLMLYDQLCKKEY